MEDTAVVKGGTYQSVASGTVTLLQSLRVDNGVLGIPRLKITDEPVYPYRGALIDPARKYHSPGGIEQVIQLCRFYRIRYLHMHLTDDQLFMFPSTKFPQLGKSNREFARFEPASMPKIAPYTLDELKGLEQYAKERGVYLVPELDLPGHSGRLIADASEIFGFPGNGSTVNIASPIRDARIYYTVGGKNPTPATGTLYRQPFLIDPEQAGEVFISGYYGPRAELRIRAFGPDDKPLGGTKWIELRCEAPRISYQLYAAPAGRTSDAMPDVAKLKPIATGKLARFKSTGKLARDRGGPLILAASGQFEALTAGEYRIVCRGKNVQLTVAGKVVAIQKDGIAPVTLAVGRHPISVLQSPGDGNVGVVLTMDKAPPDPISTDPAKPARRFTSEYLHQWMAPLPH